MKARKNLLTNMDMLCQQNQPGREIWPWESVRYDNLFRANCYTQVFNVAMFQVYAISCLS